MIKYEISDISVLSEDDIDGLYEDLSAARRERIERVKTAKARAERVVAGHILESTVRKEGFTGEISYRYDKNGKPYFDWEGAPFFSISHSGRYVAVAISDTPVGIDIEDMSAHGKTDHMAIAKRFFTDAEVAWISRQGSLPADHNETGGPTMDPDMERERFFRVWTYKEAYAKATGLSAAEHLNVWDYTKADEDALKWFLHEDALVTIICL